MSFELTKFPATRYTMMENHLFDALPKNGKKVSSADLVEKRLAMGDWDVLNPRKNITTTMQRLLEKIDEQRGAVPNRQGGQGNRPSHGRVLAGRASAGSQEAEGERQMTAVIRAVGFANGYACPHAGQWLKSFDHEAFDGQGHGVFTDDPDDAMRFDTKAEAMVFWRQAVEVETVAVGRQTEQAPDGVDRRDRGTGVTMLTRTPIYQPKLPRWEHQNNALNAIDGNDGFALFMEMRTGKTKTILDEFGQDEVDGTVRNLLVIAPGGVYRTWEADAVKHLSDDLETPHHDRVLGVRADSGADSASSSVHGLPRAREFFWSTSRRCRPRPARRSSARSFCRAATPPS